ncbi:MAG TPA: hypothetical protein VGP13_01445 [Candidatus Paceibacterota bacterium]|nr:hypothetical protein [Candidatus Paceibacterota bacterium]
MAAAAAAIPTPDEVEISPGYRIDNLGKPPSDRQISSEKRARLPRLRYVLSASAASLALPTGLSTGFFWLFSLPTFGLWLGLLPAGLGLFYSLKSGLVWNPQQVALAAWDPRINEVVPYGPGLHARLPYEVATEADNIPLQIIKHSFTIEVQTTTARAKLEILIEWRPSLENLANFTNVKDDEPTINTTLDAFLSSSLTSRLSRRSAAYVRGMLNRINVLLANEFMGEINVRTGKSPTELETDFGIDIVTIRLMKVEFPPDVQRMLDAGDEASIAQDMVAGWLGLTPDELKEALRDGRVTPEHFGQHMERAMILSGNAAFNINRIDVPGLVNNIIRR